MSWEQVVVVAAGVVALVALLLAARARARAVRAESLARDLAERIEALASPATEAPAPPVDATTYVITHLDDEGITPAGRRDAAPLARPIDGRLFADVVAREAVVSAASWSHGLRRALSPEARNRVRFAVRQETRLAGRERRAEMKQALREFRARERAAVRADASGTLGEDVA